MLLPGESHGQRSPVGYSPWGREGSDTTERHTSRKILSHRCFSMNLNNTQGDQHPGQEKEHYQFCQKASFALSCSLHPLQNLGDSFCLFLNFCELDHKIWSFVVGFFCSTLYLWDPCCCVFSFFFLLYRMFFISSGGNPLVYNILEENIRECTITYLIITFYLPK